MYPPTPGSCFKFYYNIWGKTIASDFPLTLTLKHEDGPEYQIRRFAKAYTDVPDTWSFAETNIVSGDYFQVCFELFIVQRFIVSSRISN